MAKTSQNPPTKAKPDKPMKSPEKPAQTTPESEGPLETDGGRRSPLNGRFEADHRPSR